jgi:hypothetical protein
VNIPREVVTALMRSTFGRVFRYYSSMADLPVVFAVHQLADGRWGIIGPDPNPHRPSWHRWSIVDPLTYGRRSSDRSRTDSLQRLPPPAFDVMRGDLWGSVTRGRSGIARAVLLRTWARGRFLEKTIAPFAEARLAGSFLKLHYFPRATPQANSAKLRAG